eukprot:853461-Pleurochrysis_carterae.AAC.1
MQGETSRDGRRDKQRCKESKAKLERAEAMSPLRSARSQARLRSPLSSPGSCGASALSYASNA